MAFKVTALFKKNAWAKNNLYEADTSSENFHKDFYYGISKSKFETRYSNHEIHSSTKPQNWYATIK